MMLALALLSLTFPAARSSRAMEPKIILGSPTAEVDHPYFASLYGTWNGTTYLCGSGQINAYQFVTAAHCVVRVTKSNELEFPSALHLRVVQSTAPAGARVVRVDDKCESRAHVSLPAYFSLSPCCTNDIAVVTLREPIARPAYLVVGEGELPPTLTAIGFGLDEHGELQNTLQSATLATVSEAECGKVLPKTWLNGDFCARGTRCENVSGVLRCVDSCKGDSGGPLFTYDSVRNGSVSRVFGVVSRGTSLGCGMFPRDVEEAIPAVYTDVRRHVRFLAEAPIAACRRESAPAGYSSGGPSVRGGPGSFFLFAALSAAAMSRPW
jgi:secreted trypsin-like serine protease